MDETIIMNIVQRVEHLETILTEMQSQLTKLMNNQSIMIAKPDKDCSDYEDYESDSASDSSSELVVSSDSSYESNQSVDSDFYKPVGYSIIELQKQKIEEFPEPKILLSEAELQEIKRDMEQIRLNALKQIEKTKTKPKTIQKNNNNTQDDANEEATQSVTQSYE